MIGLAERRAHAFRQAESLSSSAVLLGEISSELRSRAVELRIAACETRRRLSLPIPPGDRRPPWFTIRGVVDGRPAVVRWRPDRLDGDAEVLARANVIVAMGDEFGSGDRGNTLAASLDEPPVAVLLTILRAFTAVTSVELRTSWLRSSPDRISDD